MFEELKEKLKSNPRYNAIINSNEFYFQKGQDVMSEWLALEIPENQKILLLELSSNYEQFSLISATNHPELIEVKALIHKVISYCDDKARGKNTYNEYDDKRTLAKASVRMGPWVKNLVDYKFNRIIVTGSIKNAFEFLIDPSNNSTILSENHREFFINHYLSKPYQSESFITDLKDMFEPYNLTTKNESNYTALLSEIIYAYESDWKPKKMITFKEFVEQFQKYKLENDLSFNLLLNEGKGKFIWLSDKDSIIGGLLAHFEVGTRGIRGNKDILYVDVHFESKTKQNKDIFSQSIDELPEDLEWIDWFNSKSIGYKDSFKLNDDNLLEKIFNALEYIDETIGDTIRNIISNIPASEEKLAIVHENKLENMKSPLNQILFGPPGTGKTFNTINEALQIVDPIYYKNNIGDRKKLTDRFKELLIKSEDDKNGQIGFCTFHQSFSYEDFVEGIKPKTTDSKNVYYNIEPGIFKRICHLADSYNSTMKVKKEGKLSWDVEQYRKASFYKLSLGAIYNPNDKPIYEYCRDNSLIAIGFGKENDFTGLSESEIEEKCKDLSLEPTAAQQLNYFIHYLKKGNYVIIGNGNKYVKAIGKVTGDYEYIENSPIQYNHFRKVEWVFVDENIPIEEIYERGLSQKTMYKIDETALKMDFFTNKGQETIENINTQEKNYVLIIDEINRGNVSSIFGELITLIEKDKRSGCDEELEVILPYSKEPFKVPKNVYIIGTMNTADRSVEALDTALRRRFSFREMPPKPELILQEGKLKDKNGKIDDIDVVEILKVMNDRIEKLIDKDHKIGHSYFLGIETLEDLKQTFKDKVIPLLEEYFFGDFGKISLVLGSSFISKSNKSGVLFAKNNEYDPSVANDLLERGVYEITTTDNWNFKAIYQ